MKPLDDVQIREILESGRPARNRVAVVAVHALRAFMQIGLTVAVLAGGYYGAQKLVATKPEVARRPQAERVYTVRTVTARLGAHRPSIRAYGQVSIGRKVELRALVAGKVTAVNPGLRDGATIAAGEMLVTIDDFEYAGAIIEAKANLAEAEARLAENNARLTLERDALKRARDQLTFAVRDQERIRQLHKTGRVTDRDLDERNLLVSQREEMVEQRVNNIAIEEARRRQQEVAIRRLQWGVEEAERNLADTVLRAPFDGVVLSENVEVGRTLNENDIAVSLYEAGALEVRFQLTDQQYGDLLADVDTIAGHPLEVFWHVGDAPVRYTGTIARIGAEISAEKGGVEMYAALALDSADAPIRPGAFVEILVPGRNYPDTYKIPESAVHDGDHVFISIDGRLARRGVEIVGYDEEDAIVKGQLRPGDAVLVTRIAEVGEGLKVRVEGAASGEPANGAPRAGSDSEKAPAPKDEAVKKPAVEGPARGAAAAKRKGT